MVAGARGLPEGTTITLTSPSKAGPSDAKHRLRTAYGAGGIQPSSGLMGRAGRQEVVMSDGDHNDYPDESSLKHRSYRTERRLRITP